KGNTYTRAVGQTSNGDFLAQSIYYAKNIAAATAGANAVTVSFSAAAPYPDLRIAEYSGIDTTNPLDVAVGANSFSANSTSGLATTTNGYDLIIGANYVGTVTTGAGSGYAQRVLTDDGSILEDKVVASSGSYSATAPLSDDSSWVMQMAAFKAASSGGD